MKSLPTQAYLATLAFKAGRIMREALMPGMKMEVEWKEDDTPLTVSDRAINSLVIRELEGMFPHITVIGEEESRVVNGSDIVVLVDPIDGTIAFAQGIPASTFCISVLKEGKPILAMVHDPYLERTWYAEKGCGTTLNGKRVTVTDHTELPKSTISIMWWKGAIGNLDRVCGDIVESRAKWINLCSVAIAGGLISSGDLTASVFPGTKAWETAAMQLLVEEAGGIATDLYGNPLVYGGDYEIKGHVMSCHPAIQEALLEMVRNHNK